MICVAPVPKISKDSDVLLFCLVLARFSRASSVTSKRDPKIDDALKIGLILLKGTTPVSYNIIGAVTVNCDIF